MENKGWREELQEIIEEEETDMERPMIPRYAKGYAKLILEDFISSEIEKAELEILNQVKEIIERKSIYQEKGDECGTPIGLIEWFVDTKLEDLTSKEDK